VPRAANGMAARLAPVIMAVASLGTVAMVVASGSAAGHNPMLLAFPVLMIASAVAAVASSSGGRQRAELDADRRRYLDYLASLSDRLAKDATAERHRLLDSHPEPEALWAIVGGTRMWERHRDEADFCVVRAGVGTASPTTRLNGPTTERAGEQDPVTAAALARLLRVHGRLWQVPVTITLAAGATVSVSGDGDGARALLRAVICQLAVAHSPDDVGLVAAVGEAQSGDWDWLKWLPHRRHGPAEPDGRRLVVVVDGGDAPAPDAACAVLHIDPAAMPDADLRVVDGAGTVVLTRPDQMTPVAALAVARRLAGYRPDDEPTGETVGWLARVGVGDPVHIDPKVLWESQFCAGLRVPIGTSDDGDAVDLDIREAAADGMGPHGLCLGATGSGKSELLRTIALGMIARHSPETLNLVLIDFKGGATFLDLARSRHTTAVITNLEEEAGLVDRMRDALGGEIDRRQRILRAVGNFSGVAEYHRARQAGRPLDPLPTLFIIVDEFSELLSRHPDFVEVFVAIGRLGRSLGMHLLLASQRLDEGRLRGLDSHLSYRICLKTLSEAESRLAIGVPDAHHLPRRPGSAYLKVGAGQPIRFQAAFVSGPVPGRSPDRRTGPSDEDFVPRLFTASPPVRVSAPPSGGGDAEGATLLQAVVDGLAGHGPSPHRVWLPPLTDSPRLAALVDGYAGGGLRIPIGLVDNAFEHRRSPLVVDLSGAAGNFAVVGAPRTGKTTVVKTLVTALAATHDPRRVQVYCLDFGGGGLTELTALPHVGTVAGRSNADLVRRTVIDVLAVLRRRESAGAGADDPCGDVLLVIDGWTAARREYGGPDDLDDVVTAIAGTGLSYGVHVVLTASRWADVRPALRDQIGTRIELRLGDPADSEIDRARARLVPRDKPGHGLSPAGSPMVIALPDNTFRPTGTEWRAPAIRLLPECVGYPELLAAAPAVGCVLGIDEDGLQPVALDLTGQHLLVFGEPGCGKTAVLRLLCHEIARTVPAGLLVPLDARETLAEFGSGGLRSLPGLVDRLRDRVHGAESRVPQIYLVIDDYDLAATALAPLADVLAHARDIGLHLVIARRSGGAARALYDPILSAVRETGAAGLQLSGSPEDGPLVGGVRPRRLPPGRGVLVTRTGGERTIQVAWLESSEPR
jgi:DNA segregation ATPase FtsK/SpoIIIE, S-DNA-T family